MYCPVNGISKGFVHNCLETAAVIHTATQEIDGIPVVFLLQVQVWDLRHISRVMMRDALWPRWLLVFAYCSFVEGLNGVVTFTVNG